MKTFVPCVEVACWANDNDSLIPEKWAMEGLETLIANLVMTQLIHTDYSSEIQSYGDVVNTRRPNDFAGKRKTDDDSVVVQDAVSPNIAVPLDQHVYVSFTIKDGEMSKAFVDLVALYLEPAARELATKVDQILIGQVANLLAAGSTGVGGLQLMTKSNAPDYVLDANTELDLNKAPKASRRLVLGPRAHKACLGADLFVSSDKRGDEGTALRTASLGSVYGLDAFMDQNTPYRAPGDAEHEDAVTDAAYSAGDTAVNTTITYANVVVGDYVDIAGKVYRITAATDDTGDANITLDRGLEADVGAGDAVIHYPSGAVDLVAGYAAGYSKEIVIDGFAANKNPTVGTIVTFGTGSSSHSYTVIEATAVSTTESEVLLDRPLDAALADNDPAFFYPAGGVNLAFTRNCIAWVSRPLAQPPAATGALSYVASFGDVSMRVTMQYQGTSQGMLVTLDLLGGVAILDERLAVILWS